MMASQAVGIGPHSGDPGRQVPPPDPIELYVHYTMPLVECPCRRVVPAPPLGYTRCQHNLLANGCSVDRAEMRL